MIKPTRLTEIARKWQKMAANKRRRISFSKTGTDVHSVGTYKGHFGVYSNDHKRFVVPLRYLSQNVHRELLKTSEQEFGLPTNGPIRLPCDGTFLEYVISLIRACYVHEDLEKALITFVETCHNMASSSLGVGHNHQQAIIYGL